jgi:hypothetical protein
MSGLPCYVLRRLAPCIASVANRDFDYHALVSHATMDLAPQWKRPETMSSLELVTLVCIRQVLSIQM